jgi:hypothetical protein
MQGFIKLHREILEWEWYGDHKMLALFIHCLLKANHQQRPWRGYTIERGEFITSLDNLSRETGLTKKEVRNCLKKLEKTGEVGTRSSSQNTRVTVNKYNDYQEMGTPKAHEGHTKGTRRASNKNGEEWEEWEEKEKQEKENPDPSELYSISNPTKGKLKGWVAKAGYPEDFEELYDLSDKKRDKLAALVHWLNISESEREAVRQHWPQYAKITRNNYQKLFRTYLDDRGWEMDLKTLQSGAGTSKSKTNDPSLGF